MWLTDLADVARGAGLDVVEVDGWQTRGHGGLEAVDTVVCHHTAGPSVYSNGADYPSLGVVTNGRPGLDGPLAQLGIGRSGRVYVIAAGVAYHAGRVHENAFDNWHSIGIEAENSGSEPWPEEQMRVYVRLVRALVDAYGIPLSRVLGHKEVCYPAGRKVDPSFGMAEFRCRVGLSEGDGDMVSAQEIADAIMNMPIDREGPGAQGQTTLRATIAYLDANLGLLPGKVTQEVMNMKIDRGGGVPGQTTVKAVMAWFDKNMAVVKDTITRGKEAC